MNKPYGFFQQMIMTRPGKQHVLFSSVLMCIVLGYASITHAEIKPLVYINDILYVQIRSCPGVECRIVKSGVKSGTALHRLDTSKDEKWTQVSFVDNTDLQGWMPSQFLTEQPAARDRLAEALFKIGELEAKLKALQSSDRESNAKVADLQEKLMQATRSQSKAENELARITKLSENAIQLEKRHQDLIAEHKMLAVKRDTLSAENENLKNDHRINFLFYGAGLILLGMLLTVIIPALKPGKKYGEWR